MQLLAPWVKEYVGDITGCQEMCNKNAKQLSEVYKRLLRVIQCEDSCGPQLLVSVEILRNDLQIARHSWEQTMAETSGLLEGVCALLRKRIPHERE